MWSEETIKESVKKGLLPCGRCHKWKVKDDFEKDVKGNLFKVCKVCNTSWKEKYTASREKILGPRDVVDQQPNTCTIS